MPALGSPFIRQLRTMAAAYAARTDRSPATVDEVLAEYERQHPRRARDQSEWSRRAFLQRAGAAGAGLVAAGSLGVGRALPAAAGNQPTVAIVGGGLAGLSCAHLLAKRGVRSTVYEARAERLGGRCWTLRGFFENEQTGEHHGQYIDSRHRQLRRLAAELGIDLIDTFEQSFPAGDRDVLWIDGRDRRDGTVFADFGIFYDRLSADYERVGSYLCHEAGPRAQRFDQVTMLEWFEQNLPGGADSLLAQALGIFMTSFFGLDPQDMSAINLFEAFVAPYPGANERFRLKGGNDRLVSALVGSLGDGSIEMERPLEAIWSQNDGRVGLRFGGEAGDVIADRVVLALPFTTLRETDHAGLSLRPRKRRAIETLAMGTNGKMNLQLNRSFAALDWDASFASDEPHYVTWDSTYGQTSPAPHTPVLTIYNGGAAGRSFPTTRAHAPANEPVIEAALTALGRGVEDIRDAFNGKAYLDFPFLDPWVRGSYAGFGPGQYTDFWGCLGDREGPVHFAGEHTSTHSQGYLNGAVESGQRAAREVLQAIT
jgi:monoamine oxidase